MNDRDTAKTSLQYRDINWSVTFEVTVNGEPVDFSDLTEGEQGLILNRIAEDYYHGTFLGDEE